MKRVVSKKQAKNRGQFRPGVSGNPHGRPRLGETAGDYLAAAFTKEEWAEKITRLCRKGNLRALGLYAEYVFGRPRSEAEEEILRRIAKLEELK